MSFCLMPLITTTTLTFLHVLCLLPRSLSRLLSRSLSRSLIILLYDVHLAHRGRHAATSCFYWRYDPAMPICSNFMYPLLQARDAIDATTHLTAMVTTFFFFWHIIILCLPFSLLPFFEKLLAPSARAWTTIDYYPGLLADPPPFSAFKRTELYCPSLLNP